MWVSWTRCYLLRYTSFWDAKVTSFGSWVWRKLLKLREHAYGFLKVNVNSGLQSFFWFDNWCDKGKLIQLTGDSGTRYFGIPRQATLAEAISESNWSIRPAARRKFQHLIDTIQAIQPPDLATGSDVFLWKHSPTEFKPSFSTSKTWCQIRCSGSKVPWHHIIWFKQGIPRYSFICWLAIKDRLSTGTRMRQWGFIQDCVLCGERDESRDHLFFGCPYSYSVWWDLSRGLIHQTSPDWYDTLTAIGSPNRSYMDRVLLRLLFQSSIYLIWRERNSRIHGLQGKHFQSLSREIDKVIRNRISSLSYTHLHPLASLLRRWFEIRMV